MNDAQPKSQSSRARLQLRQVAKRSIGGRVSRQALLFIHGWGCSSEIWQSVFARLPDSYDIYCLDLPGYGENALCEVESLEQLLEQFDSDIKLLLPERFVLIGWSLGGVIATLLAKKYTNNVMALFTVATNPRFIASEKWSCGMAPSVFSSFTQQLEKNVKATLSSFYTLQCKGSVNKLQLLRTIKECSANSKIEENALRNGLYWLRNTSLLDIWSELSFPVFHSYGGQDEIVPIEVADRVESFYASHTVTRYPESSHLPFISESENWSINFLSDLSKVFSVEEKGVSSSAEKIIDAKAVEAAFNRSASRYDSLANLQRKVANDLVSEIKLERDGCLLDLGSGTGFVSRMLAGRYAGNYIQLDISHKMLQQAKASWSENALSKSEFLHADMQQLPLQSESMDAISSSLSFQWSRNVRQLFASCYDVLKPGGSLIFATLLPGSLREISDAWKKIDSTQHVHEFIDADELLTVVKESAFKVELWEAKAYIEQFQGARDLLASVSSIGAGNHRRDRSPGLTGKQRFRQLLSQLEHSELQLSYEVLIARVTKPMQAVDCE